MDGGEDDVDGGGDDVAFLRGSDGTVIGCPDWTDTGPDGSEGPDILSTTTGGCFSLPIPSLGKRD